VGLLYRPILESRGGLLEDAVTGLDVGDADDAFVLDRYRRLLGQALKHLCGFLCRLVDVVDVVLGGVDETRRELLEFVARVHKRRRVRHKGEPLHPLAEGVGGLLDVGCDLRRQLRNDRFVGELVDVVDRKRRFGVRIGGDPRAEDFACELVTAGMIGLELVGRHRYFDAAFPGFEDRFRQRDVPCDAVEKPLLRLDRFAVGVLPEIPGR